MPGLSQEISRCDRAITEDLGGVPWTSGMSLGVSEVFQGFQGVSEVYQRSSRSLKGVSGEFNVIYSGFTGVPGCCRVVRGVSGVFQQDLKGLQSRYRAFYCKELKNEFFAYSRGF